MMTGEIFEGHPLLRKSEKTAEYDIFRYLPKLTWQISEKTCQLSSLTIRKIH